MNIVNGFFVMAQVSDFMDLTVSQRPNMTNTCSSGYFLYLHILIKYDLKDFVIIYFDTRRCKNVLILIVC